MSDENRIRQHLDNLWGGPPPDAPSREEGDIGDEGTDRFINAINKVGLKLMPSLAGQENKAHCALTLLELAEIMENYRGQIMSRELRCATGVAMYGIIAMADAARLAGGANAFIVEKYGDEVAKEMQVWVAANSKGDS